MFSHSPFDCVLLLLVPLTRSLEGVYIVEVGQNADLPCSYSPAAPENLVPVCWGKGHCPVFECYGMLISTNGRSLKKQLSSRYQLKGNFHEGDVSLTIKNVTFADSGIYCCRIQFPGLMNDKKSYLELVIKPAKATLAQTPWRDYTTAFSEMFTSKEHGSDTQTPETVHDKSQTQTPTLAIELQDSGAITRIGIYIGAGISAGLALALIFGALILKRYSPNTEKRQNLSLTTSTDLPPSGLVSTVVEGMRSEENIYIIEENMYEMEDPYDYYYYISNGQHA
ncbi:hepatitis A virus cellular receptor 2 [Manis javanica]|uniref:hepatitis A virus cellular receptor 2 n=1 Tax=Manis javanica TaxID=9974 RepID=UPI003C6D3FA9